MFMLPCLMCWRCSVYFSFLDANKSTRVCHVLEQISTSTGTVGDVLTAENARILKLLEIRAATFQIRLTHHWSSATGIDKIAPDSA